ncbi:MAG: RluA family pseudouridine synthase [Saprospiraceae bacterium]|nr:RluA family pseudouridine synthase [Saprospiraceae bacterium]
MMEIPILYADDAFLVVAKPAGIATQADQTGDISLVELLSERLKILLFVVHRLDRAASGVVVFAKTSEMAALLSEQFKKRKARKIYWAIVEARPPQEEGVLIHYLKKNQKINKSFVVNIPENDGKRAELRYILRGSSDRYFFLEIELFTGRFHQIRAQLAAINCPIKGDVKYGARRSNTDRSIHLHAAELTFEHPKTHQICRFEAKTNINDALWRWLEGVLLK